MGLPFDDILKVIAKGGGAGAQIAQSAIKPRAVPKVPAPGGIANLAASFGGPKASEPSKGPGGAFGLALKGLDLGRGLLVSSLKEGIDFSQDVLAGRIGDGEWSPAEWWSQATNHYGFGDLIEDERNWVGAALMATGPATGGMGFLLGGAVMADNIWADRVVGFVGDVALDPLTYLGGYGAIARGMSATKVTQKLGRFAQMSADDMLKAGLIKSGTAAAAKPLREAAMQAANAASKGRSLSSASRSLLKTDAGKKVAKHLGLDPGLRLRLPGTGPAGRFLRQDRWLEAAGKPFGRPDWIAKRQYKNLAPAFKGMFDEDEMLGAITKFRGTSKAQKSLLQEEMVAKHGTSFAEAVGMASRSAVDVAIPGIVGKGAKLGLAANLISKVTDFPIRGVQKLPERMLDKVSANFNPNHALREMEQSDDAWRNVYAAYTRDYMRYARNFERGAINDVGEAQDAVIMRSAGLKIPDEDVTALLDYHRALVKDADFDVVEALNDRTFTGAAQVSRDPQNPWYANLPDSIKALDDEEFYLLALDLEAYAAQTGAVMRGTYGEVPLAGGAKVWGAEGAVERMEGMPWRGARRLRESARNRFMMPRHFKDDKVTPQYDFDSHRPREGKVGGTQKQRLSWDVTGRVTPASLKNRSIGQVHEPVLVYNEAGAAPGSVVDWVKDGKVQTFGTADDTGGLAGQVKRVLADPANPDTPFLVKPPDSVGLSPRRQIDDVSMGAFGEAAFEGEFSVVADAWRKGMGRDIRMQEFMKRLKEEFPTEQLDDFLDEIENAFSGWEKQGKYQANKTVKATARTVKATADREIANRQQQRAAGAAERLRTVDTPAVQKAQLEVDRLDAEQASWVEEMADLERFATEAGVELSELQRVARQASTKAYKDIQARSNRVVLAMSDAAARLEFIKDAAERGRAVREAQVAIIRKDADLFAAEVADPLEAVKASAEESTRLKAAYDADMARLPELRKQYDAAVERLGTLSKGRGVEGLRRTLEKAEAEVLRTSDEAAAKAWVASDPGVAEADERLGLLRRMVADNKETLERLIGPEGRVRFEDPLDAAEGFWRVEGNVGGELGAARARMAEAIAARTPGKTRRTGRAAAVKYLEKHERNVLDAARKLLVSQERLAAFFKEVDALPRVKMDAEAAARYQKLAAGELEKFEQAGGMRDLYEALPDGARLNAPEGLKSEASTPPSIPGSEISQDFTQTGTSRLPSGPKGPPKRLTVGETADWLKADRDAFIKGDKEKGIPPGVIGGDARRGELIPAATVSNADPRYQAKSRLGGWDEAHSKVERLTVQAEEAAVVRKSLGSGTPAKKGERVEGVWVKGESAKVRLTKEGKRRAEIPAQRAALEERIAAGREEFVDPTRPSMEWRARAEERVATGKARIAEWDAADPSTVDAPHWLPAARRRVAELEQQIELAAKTEAAGVPVPRMRAERVAVQRRVAELERELLSPALELKPTYQQAKAAEEGIKAELAAARKIVEAQDQLAERAFATIRGARRPLPVEGFERGYRTSGPRGSKGTAEFTPEPLVRPKMSGALSQKGKRLREQARVAAAAAEALENPQYVETVDAARLVIEESDNADALLQRAKATAKLAEATAGKHDGAVTEAMRAWDAAATGGQRVRLTGVPAGTPSSGRLLATNPANSSEGIVSVGAEGSEKILMARRADLEWKVLPDAVPPKAQLEKQGWSFSTDTPVKGQLAADDPVVLRLERATRAERRAAVAAEEATDNLESAVDTLGIPYKSDLAATRTHPVVPPAAVKKIKAAIAGIEGGGAGYNTDPRVQDAISEARRYTYVEAQQLTDLQVLADDAAAELLQRGQVLDAATDAARRAGGLRPEARASWAVKEAREAGVALAEGRSLSAVAEPARPASVQGWYTTRREFDEVFGLDVERLNAGIGHVEELITDANLKAVGVAKSSPEVRAMRALRRVFAGGDRRGSEFYEVAGTRVIRDAGRHPEDLEEVARLKTVAERQRVAAEKARAKGVSEEALEALDKKVVATQRQIDNLYAASRRQRAADPLERAEDWVRNFEVLDELERAVGHDAFIAATRGVTAAIEGRSGVEAFNTAYKKVMDQLGLQDWATSGVLKDPRQGRLVGSRRAVRDVPIGGQGELKVTLGGREQSVEDVAARLSFGKELEGAHTRATKNLTDAQAEVVRVTKYGDRETQRATKKLETIARLEKEASDAELREWASFLETGDEVQVAEFRRLLGGAEPTTDVVTREAMTGATRPNTVERSFQEVMGGVQRRAEAVGRPGVQVDESVKKGIFSLDKKERGIAQLALKDAVSKSEWGPWTLMSGDAALDSDMMNVIEAFAKINDHESWGVLWSGWNKIQTYLKSAMIATPGFVQRNIFGAFFNAWLDGVNLDEIISSTKMTMRIAREASDKNVSFLNAARGLAKGTDDAGMRSYVRLLEVGVRGGGQAVSAVELGIGLRNARHMELLLGGRTGTKQRSISLKPWSPRFAPYQSVRTVNSWVEDIVRLGVGMDTLRYGGSVDDALSRIAKSQFDYDELTQFERRWMKSIFPFYTWTRKNVPYQLKQIAANPEKYNRLLAAKRNLELGTEEDGVVPDYFLEPFGMRLPFSAKGGTVYSAPDIPFQDLGRYDPFQRGGWKKGATNLVSGASPLLKAPLEVAFGKQVFNGIPFSGRYQKAPAAISGVPFLMDALALTNVAVRSPNGDWKMRDHHIYMITNILPTLGVARRLLPNEPKYQRNFTRSLLSTMFGMSANFNTPEVQSNWLRSQRYERLAERNDRMDIISRTR